MSDEELSISDATLIARLRNDHPDYLTAAAADRIDELITIRDTLRRLLAKQTVRAERLEAALTPSGETKAAYIGEFSIPFETVDTDGNEVTMHKQVPWTTTKEIMAVIRAYAALKGADHE